MPAWLQHDWCSSFVLTLGHFVWQGTLIAIVLAIALRATKKVSVRYWLSLAALLVMAACPIVTLGWLMQPVSSGSGLQNSELADQEFSPLQQPAPPILNFEDLTPASRDVGHVSNVPVITPAPTLELNTDPSGRSPNLQPPADDRSWWQKVAPQLTTMYLCGVALMLLRLVIGLWGGRRLRRRVHLIDDSSLLNAMQRQATALGLKLLPVLAYCERVTVPTVVGVLKPMILLPLTLTSGLSPEQMESVLAHELAHLRRYDHLVNLLQRVIESLLFFHPAMWWVSHRIRDEREHCCDDLVVACGALPLDYAKSLLVVAELSRRGRETRAELGRSVAAVSLLATGHQKPSNLRQRIARLLGESATPSLRVSPRALLLAIGIPLVAMIVTIQSGASNQHPSPPGDNEATSSDSSNDETPAVVKFPPPNREDVRGLDLSRVAVRGYSAALRQSPDQQTAELSVPDPANPGSWKQPKNVFQMPLAQHTWLKYPAGSGHFYIEHRSDGSPESEQLYGPIEGDPFDVLKLDELLGERLKPDDNSVGSDSRFRLRLMFRTGDPSLMRRAWQLVEPHLARQFENRNERGLFKRLEMLEIVRKALRDEAAAFRKPGMSDLAARIREVVSTAEASIDALNDAVPDEQYEPVSYLQPKIAAKIPDALWGQPVSGLRLGLVPRDAAPDSDWNTLLAEASLPTSVTAQPGQELRYQLLVENVSDREIKLSGYVGGEEMARSVEVLDRNGQPAQIDSLHTDIPHFPSYWRLKPGERQLLMMPAVYFEPVSLDPPGKGLGYHVKTDAGQYSLRCSIRFGDLDNERHRHIPGQSEWIGKLTTGSQKITVAVAEPDRNDTDTVETSPPKGLEFLKPYPKLHGLSLEMTEPQFLEIVKQQELKTKKIGEGKKGYGA